MSRANRQTFVFLVSLLSIAEAAKAHPETTEAELSWWNRITDFLTSGGTFPVKMEVTPKQLDKLRAQAKDISLLMAKNYSVMVLINVWMAWCEDRIQLLDGPRREFYETLLTELDGLYALYDAQYQRRGDVEKAIQAAKELERAVA